MYDTRWPRPGPAMAAVAAVLGLVAGAVFALSSASSAPSAQASAPVETTVAHPTTTLPERFHTVILGSYNEQANAEARLRQVRGLGVRDAAILTRAEYQLRTAYAVYSGRYGTRAEAMAHLQELAGYGIPPQGRFYKEVTRTA
jgi:ABC-type glycerol-3-phosphate transport system substrate-binding protein